MTGSNTAELLSDYLDILNHYGFDSVEEIIFVKTHEENDSLQRQMRMARRIKVALCNREPCAGPGWERGPGRL